MKMKTAKENIDAGDILGADFDAVPPHWATVYRECSPEELERIRLDGLAAPPPECRPAKFRQEMEMLDRFRPPAVVERGVSRLNAIYAAPTPADVPCLDCRRERVVLAMRIDPAAAGVGDMHFITCLIPFLGAHRFSLDKYQGAFRKYWEGIIGFEDFRRHYERALMGNGGWRRRADAPTELPERFFSPEILILLPRIDQRHIRVRET